MKKLSVHGTPYRLNLLDTAGQERFRTLSNSYYRNAHGVILVYDISNRESFLAMERWFEEVESNAMPGTVLYLVGSKLDKSAQRKVKYEEGLKLAESKGLEGRFCEVSSKTRENVRKPFVEVVEAVVSRPELLKMGTRRGAVNVGQNGDTLGGGCSC
jgi:Ras-related protein Rab-18